MLLIVHQYFIMILSRKIIVRKEPLQTTNKFFINALISLPRPYTHATFLQTYDMCSSEILKTEFHITALLKTFFKNQQDEPVMK